MRQMTGITTETRSLNRVEFPVEGAYVEYKNNQRLHPFHEAVITKVEALRSVSKKHKLKEDTKAEEGDEITIDMVTPESILDSLSFVFESPDGTYYYQLRLFGIQEDDPKYVNKERMLNERIAHIFDALGGVGSAAEFLAINKLFKQGEKQSWELYFKRIAEVFNTAKDGKPVFNKKDDTPILLRIKLTRNRGNKRNPNEITMPLGNVVEKVLPNGLSTLAVTKDDEFTIIEQAKSALPLATKEATFGAASQTTADWEDL